MKDCSNTDQRQMLLFPDDVRLFLEDAPAPLPPTAATFSKTATIISFSEVKRTKETTQDKRVTKRVLDLLAL